jgi:L-lactate dehydrogenase
LKSPKIKITIVGSGAIGTTIAYSLLLRRADLELVLVNRDERRAGAKAFDMSHCLPRGEGSSIRAGRAEDSAGSGIVVMTAGVLPKADGKRSDVLLDNIELYRSILPPLAAKSPEAVFIVITNPNDSMAYAAFKLSGLPASRVIGTGTLLDGMRLRGFIAEAYGLDPSKVEAQVIGEHGDSMVPLWSRAAYEGIPLESYLRDSRKNFDDAAKLGILERTKRAGWEIRLAGEHSCYGISFSTLRIIEGILEPSEDEPTLSAFIPAGSGIGPLAGDAFMSLPVKLGRGGLGSVHMPALSEGEAAALRESGLALRAQMDEVDSLIGPSRLGN